MESKAYIMTVKMNNLQQGFEWQGTDIFMTKLFFASQLAENHSFSYNQRKFYFFALDCFLAFTFASAEKKQNS